VILIQVKNVYTHGERVERGTHLLGIGLALGSGLLKSRRFIPIENEFRVVRNW
jgi:hypothetical protein